MSWPSSSPSLETQLSKKNNLISCWQQLNPAASTLPSTALNFLMEAILTAIRRPGILALTDSWVTVKTMTAPPLTCLKDRVLLLTGASETLGAELLQLLLQSAAPALKQLIIVQGEGEKMSKELHGVLGSTGFPIVLVDSASQGTNSHRRKKIPSIYMNGIWWNDLIQKQSDRVHYLQGSFSPRIRAPVLVSFVDCLPACRFERYLALCGFPVFCRFCAKIAT